MNSFMPPKLEDLEKWIHSQKYTVFPELNQEEITNLNRMINSSKIESVIKKHLANRSPGLDDFMGEFYQTDIEEIICVFLKLFQNTEEKRTPKFIL